MPQVCDFQRGCTSTQLCHPWRLLHPLRQRVYPNECYRERMSLWVLIKSLAITFNT